MRGKAEQKMQLPPPFRDCAISPSDPESLVGSSFPNPEPRVDPKVRYVMLHTDL